MMNAARTKIYGYTTSEAAAELGIDWRTVSAQCAKGRFPGAVKRGRDWLIPDEAMADYKANRLGTRGTAKGKK